MDLSTLKPVTIKVDINHPGTGLPTGLVIEVASVETEAVKKMQRKNIDKALRSRNRKLTAEQLEHSNREMVAAAVVSWDWSKDATWVGGKKLEFTFDNVMTVLGADWVYSQVKETVDDNAAFFTS